MNYLKKKINKHKAANRNHDDDDVYDYIPAVPPHPSELQETESDRPNGQLSEEELRKREEKRRQLEEKKKQLEETKKGQEAWKFFEQLNQRVSDTVTKSQIVIETLKDSTTADELIREAEIELGFPAQDSDDEEPQKGATFSRGSWVGFDDQQFEKSESPAPPVASASSQKTSAAATPITPVVPFVVDTILAPEPVALPEKPSVVVDLFENFEFENENQSAEPEASTEEDDPFDTSYVSVSPVDPKVAAEVISSSEKVDSLHSNVNKTSRRDVSPVRPENLNLGMESESDKRNSSVTPDAASLPPDDAIGDADFDNDVTDLYLQQNRRIHTSRYGSTTSLASILSNPFLNEDFQDDFNPPDNVSIAGSVTPGKRRGSTNPFEDSPGDESPPGSTGASAIAALTADFCSAIESADEIVVRPDSSAPPDSESVDDKNRKPVAVVEPVSPQVIEPDDMEPESNEVEPEPIVEEPKEETHELSHEEDSYETGANELLQPEDKSGPPPPPPSAEPFDPFATIVDDHHDEESDSLQPPRLPDYPSDVSDVEDQETRQEVSSKRESVTEFRTNEAQQQGGESVPRRRSSAFDIRPDHSSKRSSVSSSSSRRASVIPRSKPFDPFQQVDEDSATPPREEDESVANTEYLEEQAPSIEPSPNYAMDQTFDDFPPPEDVVSTGAENADQVSEKEELKIIPETEEPLPPPPESLLSNHVGPEFTDPSVDPFDTSNFSFEPVADAVQVTDKSSFDAFTSRFQNTSEHGTSGEAVDAFASPLPARKVTEGSGFDTFNPNVGKKGKKQKESKGGDDSSSSSDDDDGAEHFKIVIKAKMRDPVQSAANASIPMPLIPPPPKTPVKGPRERGEFDEFESFFTRKASVAKPAAKEDDSPVESSVRSTDRSDYQPPVLGEVPAKRGDSTESPSTPLYDTDVSQPLEEFPAKYQGDGWEMFIRYPPKKKLTGQRFWKKIYVRVSENSIIQLFNTCNDTDPFQELPLQPSYSLSEISAQQYDQFGKIFTVKLQYIFYRERVGVRKGQIAKVIQGQVTSFGSIAKLGMPLDHAPQVSELIKLGTQNYDDARSIQQVVEEALFRMPLHRDRALTYKTEEIQITVADEYYVEQNRMGTILKQLARVRIFLIAFLNGMPGVEIGVNDLTRQGKEVVGRYDIIPVVTEEWIRLEDYEFHSCVMAEEFEKTRTIKLIPPDACYFELMRFRVRPPRNRELPLQVTANLYVTNTKVELRCEVLVPGAVSKKYGQIPCEDIVIRIHIPECWIYFFRTEKHMRFGSVKSAARRPGKIKGLDRILGAAQNLEPTMLEASAGAAKYEHVFHSLVWRIPRLPKEGQGAYTQQLMTLNLPLSNFDQVPDRFYEFVHVEFTMPSTTVSHAVVRSVSVTCEEPPEKFVKNVSKHEYKVEMGIHFDYEEENAFMAAAVIPRKAPPASLPLSQNTVM